MNNNVKDLIRESPPVLSGFNGHGNVYSGGGLQLTKLRLLPLMPLNLTIWGK
jgi:hypothetical protein